jgi:hypothetical protein
MDILYDLENDGVRRDNVKAHSQVAGVISYYLDFAMFVRSIYLHRKTRNNKLNIFF